MSKILFGTHVDLDGIGGAILARFFQNSISNESIDIIAHDYEDPEFPYDRLKDYQEIWFTDFTPDEKCRKIIEENNLVCKIFDHHIGIKEEIDNWKYTNKLYIFDNDRCGTKIFYDWLVETFSIPTNECVNSFVNIVNTYDLYKQKDDLWYMADSLNRLLFKKRIYQITGIDSYELFCKMMLNKLENSPTFVFNTIEQSIINEDRRKEDAMFYELISGKNPIKTRVDSLGRHFCLIKTSSKISALCNRLMEKYNKVDYVIALNTYPKANHAISLRSREGISLLDYKDVAGHEHAAGLVGANKEIFDALWENKIHCLEVKNDNT